MPFVSRGGCLFIYESGANVNKEYGVDVVNQVYTPKIANKIQEAEKMTFRREHVQCPSMPRILYSNFVRNLSTMPVHWCSLRKGGMPQFQLFENPLRPLHSLFTACDVYPSSELISWRSAGTCCWVLMISPWLVACNIFWREFERSFLRIINILAYISANTLQSMTLNKRLVSAL